MKEKTSITLSKEVLTRIDRIAGSKQSRSAFIEAVLTQYLRKRARAQVEARDLELINKAADELNAEVEDILRYQDPTHRLRQGLKMRTCDEAKFIAYISPAVLPETIPNSIAASSL